MSNLIRLTKPDLKFKDVARHLGKLIDSGWLTKGPKTDEFQDAARRYFGMKHAIAVSSGTAALHLSLLSLGIGQKDEVIVPDFTFPATANVIELCGAKAVFADINPDDFNIMTSDIEKRISKRTRAIICVHQFGYPADMEEIVRIAKKYKLFLIEDAACAVGSKYRGKLCGTFSDIGCFSFHPRKIIATGEGGMFLTNSNILARNCMRLREHGMIEQGAERVVAGLGFNYRISDVSSCLGIAQLEKLKDYVHKRRILALEFRALLRDNLRKVQPIPVNIGEGKYPNFQAFIIKINKNISNLKVISSMRKKGIESVVANYALHLQPYYRDKYNLKARDFKNSYIAAKRSIALPFHTGMDKRDMVNVISALKGILSI